MVFFRGKFRRVESSDSDSDGESEPPPLIGDPATEAVLGMGCLVVATLITLAVMGAFLSLDLAGTLGPA